MQCNALQWPQSYWAHPASGLGSNWKAHALQELRPSNLIKPSEYLNAQFLRLV